MLWPERFIPEMQKLVNIWTSSLSLFFFPAKINTALNRDIILF